GTGACVKESSGAWKCWGYGAGYSAAGAWLTASAGDRPTIPTAMPSSSYEMSEFSPHRHGFGCAVTKARDNIFCWGYPANLDFHFPAGNRYVGSDASALPRIIANM